MLLRSQQALLGPLPSLSSNITALGYFMALLQPPLSQEGLAGANSVRLHRQEIVGGPSPSAPLR